MSVQQWHKAAAPICHDHSKITKTLDYLIMPQRGVRADMIGFQLHNHAKAALNAQGDQVVAGYQLQYISSPQNYIELTSGCCKVTRAYLANRAAGDHGP